MQKFVDEIDQEYYSNETKHKKLIKQKNLVKQLSSSSVQNIQKYINSQWDIVFLFIFQEVVENNL